MSNDNKGRAVWGSKFGFLMAAIGSAVGLGNIWRFSYVAYDNGGATFMIPYLVAILVAGIPIMILEYGLGHKERGAAPLAFHRGNKRWEWVGWWMPTIATVGIQLFYAVVMAWCLRYLMFSFNLSWGTDTQSFFFNKFLNISDKLAQEGNSPFLLGSINWDILVSTLIIWFICWLICYREVNHGIEKACSIFMPLLFVLTSILVVWTLTLDGAMDGVRAYIVDVDFDKLKDTKTWSAAFGQIFFSLSLGFGIMITYASYLPKKANITKNALITTFCNCGYSIFAGFAVFATLGFMLNQQKGNFADYNKEICSFKETITNIESSDRKKLELEKLNSLLTSNASINKIYAKQITKLTSAKLTVLTVDKKLNEEQLAALKTATQEEVSSNFPPFKSAERVCVIPDPELNEVVSKGPALAFITYPEAISQLPFANKLFGVLFFFTLLVAGLSSGISLIEAFTCSIIDKFKIPRGKVVTCICVLGFFGSVIFTTNAGLIVLDIVDHFVNQYGLLVGGLAECIFIGWIVKSRYIRKHINESKEGGLNLPKVWDIMIKYVCPVVLGYILYNSFQNDLSKNYEGYSTDALAVYGALFIVLTVIAAFVMAFIPWKEKPPKHKPEDEHLLT